MAETTISATVALEADDSGGTTYNLTVFSTDASGSALHDVAVTLDGPSTRSGSTGDSAAVTFKDIKPGEYTVTGSKDGYHDATATVTVE